MLIFWLSLTQPVANGFIFRQCACCLRHTSSVRRPYTFSSGRRRNCFGSDPLGFMLGRSDSVSFINYWSEHSKVF